MEVDGRIVSGDEYSDDPDDALFIEHLASLNIEGSVKYPERILDRLFARICDEESRHYERYGKFATKYGESLKNIMLQALRIEVKDLFAEAEGEVKTVRVSQLGGNLSSYGRGIYLHIVRLPCGKPYWYIGQAYNLSFRINKQHNDFRYRRDHPSFHNFIVDRSIKDRFVILATLAQSCESADLVLNFLEMWCCMLFQCLQPQDIDEWLKTHDRMVFDQDVYCANVALPLDSGDERYSKLSINLLKEAEDELAAEYYQAVKTGKFRPKATPSPRKNTPVMRLGVEAIAPVVEDDKLLIGILLGITGSVSVYMFWQSLWRRRG